MESDLIEVHYGEYYTTQGCPLWQHRNSPIPFSISNTFKTIFSSSTLCNIIEELCFTRLLVYTGRGNKSLVLGFSIYKWRVVGRGSVLEARQMPKRKSMAFLGKKACTREATTRRKHNTHTCKEGVHKGSDKWKEEQHTRM